MHKKTEKKDNQNYNKFEYPEKIAFLINRMKLN